jgi:hypothetical protein
MTDCSNRSCRRTRGECGVSVETLEDRVLFDATPLRRLSVPASIGTPADVLRVNVGGDAFTDSKGLTWAAEFGFTGGKSVRSKFAVAGTQDDPLFADRQMGHFLHFTAPVPNGTYDLSLAFVDTLRKPGRRTISVKAQQSYLTTLDIAERVRPRTALVLHYGVTVYDGTLDLRLISYDRDGAVLSALSLAPPGAVLPLPPTDLTAVGTVDAALVPRILLNWTDASHNEASFELERSTGAGATFEPLANLSADAEKWEDLTVTPNVTYRYRVRAVNEAGPSAWSNLAVETGPPPTPQPPAAPSNLTAFQVVDAALIPLQWRDNSLNEDHFELQRSDDGGESFHPLAVLSAGVFYKDDFSVTGGETYQYRVRAVNAEGASAWSNVVTWTAPYSFPLP